MPQPGPIARLILEHPVYQEFLLGDQTRMGRSPESDILFEEDTQVSREHAKIVREGEQYYVIDLQSRNGTSLTLDPGAGFGQGEAIVSGRAAPDFIHQHQ